MGPQDADDGLSAGLDKSPFSVPSCGPGGSRGYLHTLGAAGATRPLSRVAGCCLQGPGLWVQAAPAPAGRALGQEALNLNMYPPPPEARFSCVRQVPGALRGPAWESPLGQGNTGQGGHGAL